MTEKEITKEFLRLFAMEWDDPDALNRARELHRRVSGHGQWPKIIESLRVAIEKKPEDSIGLLKEILSREPGNSCASLLLASILSLDSGQPEEAISIYDSLLAQGFQGQPLPDEMEASTRLNKGVALGNIGKYEEEIRVYDEVVQRFGESSELTVRQRTACALVNKGAALGKMGRNEEEMRICEEVVRRFGETEDLPVQQQVIMALVNKGLALGKMGNFHEAILVFDDLVQRFGDFHDLALRKRVAKALINKGSALWLMGKAGKAIRVYDDVVQRFGESEDLSLREQVAQAMFNKEAVFWQMGRFEEAIRSCGELVQRFGEFAHSTLREWVAKALITKGVALGQMGRSEEAIRVYDEIVQRFGESEDLSLRESVARALVAKGARLAETGRPEEEIGVYDEVLKRFAESQDLRLRESVAMALLSKAACLLDTDRVKEAWELFSAVGRDYLGTEELRSKLAPFYAHLHSRFASKIRPDEEEQTAEQAKTALDITRDNLESNLRVYLTLVLQHVTPEKQKEYFRKIEDAEKLATGFIQGDSQFSSEFSFLLVLREWNSYTPVIPRQEESDRGGGYFIKHAGEGIVIDPGYDFIENFHRAGGLLCDIDHVIVTHAHDDHTAELEALLMLLSRRWTAKELPNKKRMSLYLAAGVQRKFAGLLDLRDPKFRRIVTLCPADKGFEQRIRLNSETELNVLPAYHDDVITQNAAVGLAFEFATKRGKRRVVFTGDSGLYPVKLGEDGKRILYDNNEETPMLDMAEGKALYKRYPDACLKPDLLVAHIGSIKKNEFQPQETVRSRDDEGRWYYVNHLGLLGTLTMLHQLNPEAAVVSEFGSELKGFHVELVDKLQQALHARQQQDSSEGRLTFVIPGDLTIAYDITNHRFLCHETCKFTDPGDLFCRQAVDCLRKWNDTTKRNEAQTNPGTSRTYLFKNTRPPEDGAQDNLNAQNYYQRFFNHELPYHKK